MLVKHSEDLLNELASIDTSEKDFDCIVPVSGGLDSFYVAHYLTHRLNLRCLGVHYDHGLGSKSKLPMLQWIEDKLGMKIINKPPR